MVTSTWKEFLEGFEKVQPLDVAKIVEELYNWFTETFAHGNVKFGGTKHPNARFYFQNMSIPIISIWYPYPKQCYGHLQLNYGWMKKHFAAGVLKKFHEMHGLKVTDDFTRHPSVSVVDAFEGDPEVTENFRKAIVWLSGQTHKTS